VVFLLELIAGATEFKLGFSGMRLSQEEMASNVKVSSYDTLEALSCTDNYS
jgi:hypothetical protein